MMHLNSVFNDSTFGDTVCALELDKPFTKQTLDVMVTYASMYWIVHICEISRYPDNFGRDLYIFLSRNVLHWLEALSFIGLSRNAAEALKQLYH
jgi:hypothetical protein